MSFFHKCDFILRAGSNVCFTHDYYHDITGDAPYDRGADTCIAENGVDVEDPCTRDFGYGPTFKCSEPQVNNTW